MEMKTAIGIMDIREEAEKRQMLQAANKIYYEYEVKVRV